MLLLCNSTFLPFIVASMIATVLAAPAPAAPSALPTPSSHFTAPWPAIEVLHPFYDAALFTPSYAEGRFAVLTGSAHPASTTVMPPLLDSYRADVLRDGYPNNVWSVRSYASGRDFVSAPHLPWSIAQDGFSCEVLDEHATPTYEAVTVAGRVVAARETWLLESPPDRLLIEQEIRPVGTSHASSSVALILRVTNMGTDDAVLGRRLLLNPDVGVPIGGNDGPNIGLRPPDPPAEPLLSFEHEWRAPAAREWDLYGVRRPRRERWLYHIGGSINGTSLLVPAATPPDQLVFAAGNDPGGDGLLFACFAYDVGLPPRPVGGDYSAPDNALSYLWGPTVGQATSLPPGATLETVVHVYAYIDYPVTCAAIAPAPVECAGAVTSIPLDGTPSAASDGTPLRFTWSSSDPSVGFDDEHSPTPIARVPGPGRYPIRLVTEVGPYGGEATITADVVDTTPPVLVAPALVVRRTSEETPPRCGTLVALAASATDACASDDVVVANSRTSNGADASDAFPVGETLVTFEATDPSGNMSRVETLVRVIDDSPPTIAAISAYPRELWPPNHRMEEVALAAVVTDNCDPAPAVTIVSATSSEPADGLGDGDASPDIELPPGGGTTLRLRAERSGSGKGRTYTVLLESRDRDGNVARAQVDVLVPHDRRRDR